MAHRILGREERLRPHLDAAWERQRGLRGRGSAQGVLPLPACFLLGQLVLSEALRSAILLQGRDLGCSFPILFLVPSVAAQ